jgi:hypothetical protein
MVIRVVIVLLRSQIFIGGGRAMCKEKRKHGCTLEYLLKSERDKEYPREEKKGKKSSTWVPNLHAYHQNLKSQGKAF